MKVKETFMEPLLQAAGEYGKTSIELIKLKTLDKTAAVTSSIISRSLFFVIFLFFFLILNIALSLWVGEMLGKNYLGFLAVALFYGVIAFIILLSHTALKRKVGDFIITQILN